MNNPKDKYYVRKIPDIAGRKDWSVQYGHILLKFVGSRSTWAAAMDLVWSRLASTKKWRDLEKLSKGPTR